MTKEQEKILVDYQEQWIHQLPKLRNIANEFDIFPQIVRCSEIKGSQVLSRMVVQPKCVAILIFIKVAARKPDRLVLQDECGSNHFTL